MAWEKIERRVVGGAMQYGADWARLPAISLGRSGLSLNRAFCDAFGLKRDGAVEMLVDREGRKIGIKVIANGDVNTTFFRLRRSSNKSRTCSITNKAVPRMFPDCVGRAYRAHLNPGERVIEIELSPENQLK